MSLIPVESLGLYVQLACLWEVTARKPGNVHRFVDFDDVNYLDFAASAAAIAPVFDRIALLQNGLPLSDMTESFILSAIERTRLVVNTNTNLGMVLLLVPLALASRKKDLRVGVREVLEQLTVSDAQMTYQAIRLANPGGMGQVGDHDLRTEPQKTLREVMTLAADRDLVACQYANGFREVFDDGVPALQCGLKELGCLEAAIVFCHLSILARHPDSLIARKCGIELAVEGSRRSSDVINAGWPHTAEGRMAIAELDAWLRADGHRRNPGTTADLVTASLFAALRGGTITLPLHVPWSRSYAANDHEQSLQQNGQPKTP